MTIPSHKKRKNILTVFIIIKNKQSYGVYMQFFPLLVGQHLKTAVGTSADAVTDASSVSSLFWIMGNIDRPRYILSAAKPPATVSITTVENSQ